MKKTNIAAGLITCIFAATAMMNGAYAQSWSLNGNAGTTASNWLGTSDSKALTIKTNNAKRITITSGGKIGVGTTTPKYKFDVFGGTGGGDTLAVIRGLVKKTGNYDIRGIEGTSQPASGYGIGVYGTGNYLGCYGNGGRFGGLFNGFYGVQGQGNAADTLLASGEVHGITGITNLGHSAVGVYGGATSAAINYAILGYSPDTSATSVDFAGLFIGDIGFTGKAFDVSDINFKQNIQNLNSGLDMISKLRPTTYKFRTSEFPELGFSSRPQYGFIAQEVESVYPELVKNSFIPARYSNDRNHTKISNEIPFKSVDYISVIPMVVRAVQEQQQMIVQKDAVIAQQNDKIANLENQISQLADLMQKSGQITQEQKKAIIKSTDMTKLYQNQPNPSNGNTIIGYYIPSSINTAVLNVTNASGVVVKSVAISQRGNGQLTINISEFVSGNYTYSLVVDGKVIDSKTMVMTE